MAAMPDAPAVTPIAVRDEDLERVTFNEDGLVAAIVQDVETRAVLMMAWMNAETLRMSLEQGRTVFWSRSRRRCGARATPPATASSSAPPTYDCDGDTLLFLVEQEGNGRLPHRQLHLLLPGLRLRRRRPPTAPARSERRPAPHGRPLPRALPHPRSLTTGWSRCAETLLADLTTPLAASPGSCGPDGAADGTGRTGFLLESVDHGGRWSRWSFIGRDPRARLVARGTRVDAHRRGARWHPDRPGGARRARGAAGHYRSPTAGARSGPTCRRCTPAWSATSATTWCGRWSACPTCRTTTRAGPTPCCR